MGTVKVFFEVGIIAHHDGGWNRWALNKRADKHEMIHAARALGYDINNVYLINKERQVPIEKGFIKNIYLFFGIDIGVYSDPMVYVKRIKD